MSYSDERVVRCGCGHEGVYRVVLSVNGRVDRALHASICDGRFNVVSCVRCGRFMYVEVPFFYIDERRRVVWYVFPAEVEDPERCRREAAMHFELSCGAVEDPSEDIRKFTLEVLFGIEALAEQLRLAEAVDEEQDVVELVAADIGVRMHRLSGVLQSRFRLLSAVPVSAGRTHPTVDDVMAGLRTVLTHIGDLTVYGALHRALTGAGPEAESLRRSLQDCLRRKRT